MKHTMLKCLSLVMALATLVSVCALPAIVQAATPCNHYAYTTFGEDSADYVGVKESTCTEWGGKVYTCPKCHKDFVDSRDWANGQYKPLGHNFVEVEGTRVNPTLTEAGKYTEQCTRCGIKNEVPLSAIKCTLNGKQCQYIITNTATCTEEGVITKTCKVCNDVITEASPALGHTWDNGVIVKAPECGTHKEMVGGVEVDVPNYGTIKFTCTVDGCDGERVDDKVLPASGSHKWEWVDAQPTACGVAGNTAGYRCAYCDADHPTEDYEVIPAPEHQLTLKNDETHVNVALGCVDEVVWAQCSVCEEWIDVSAATATGKGTYPANGIYKPGQNWVGNHYVPTTETVADGVTYVQVVINAQGALDEGEMVVVTAATCEAAAIYKCSVTGCTHVREVGTVKPHRFTNEMLPTCTQYGFKTCADCGATAGYKDLEGNVINPQYNKQEHAPANVADIQTQDPTCTERGYDYFECQWCHQTIQTNFVPATGHTGKVVTQAKPATCTEGGWNEYWDCTVCGGKSYTVTAGANGEPVYSYTVAALGHDWENHTDLPANCWYGVHDGQLCKRCGIENKDYVVTIDDGNKDLTKHVFDGSKVLYTAPTCSKPGSTRNYCIYCYAEDRVEIAPLHHSFEVLNDAGEVIAYKDAIGKVPATCFASGYYVFYCTNENCDLDVTAADAAYTGEQRTINGDTYNFVHTNLFTVSVDERDRWASHYKTVNYTVTVDAEGVMTFAVNYDGCAHDADGKTGVLVGPALNGTQASCTQSSYYEYECTNCAYTYNKKLSDSFGLTGDHVRYNVPATPATCTVPGWEGKVTCARCNAVLEAGHETTAAHTFDVNNTTYPYTENKAPTCTQVGWAKDGFCTVCQAPAREGEIPATGHSVGENPVQVPAQFVNCYVAGWDAHYKCAACDAVLNNAALVDAEGNALEGDALKAAMENQNNWYLNLAAAIDPATGKAINGYVAPFGHHMVLDHTEEYACLKDGYQSFVCDYEGCDHVYVQNNYYFGFANHRYTDKTNVVERADGTLVECADSHLLCDNKVQVKNNNTITLVDCNDKKVVNVAVPHKNDDGELIKGFDDCTEWDKDQDHVCVYCKVDFDFDKIHEAGDNYNEWHHEADCKNAYDYDLLICRKCQHEVVKNVVETTKPLDQRHVWNVVQTVAPSYIAGGYTDYECAVCGETKQTTTKALEGVKVDISATNKFEGYEIFDGSIVAVKVTTSAFNVGATSIKVTMTYNKDVFTYIGFSADNAFGKASFDGLANTTYNPAATNAAYGADGVVTMASVAEKTANGQLQNVTLNGKETYMTLYFRVANNATSAAAPFGFEIVESTATEENTQVLGVVANATTGALETAPVKTVVGDAVELATEINKIADINGDLIIGMEDVEAMRKLVLKAAGYTAPVAGAADIDKDGDVDIDDYALLQKYILGMVDYTALANELVGTAL